MSNTWLSRDASHELCSRVAQHERTVADRSGNCFRNQEQFPPNLSAMPLSVWMGRNYHTRTFAPSLARVHRASSSASLAFLSSRARTSPQFFRPGVSDRCTLSAITSASAASMDSRTRCNRSRCSSNASLAHCSWRFKGLRTITRTLGIRTRLRWSKTYAKAPIVSLGFLNLLKGNTHQESTNFVPSPAALPGKGLLPPAALLRLPG